jgi:hypothetical protein
MSDDPSGLLDYTLVYAAMASSTSSRGRGRTWRQTPINGCALNREPLRNFSRPQSFGP